MIPKDLLNKIHCVLTDESDFIGVDNNQCIKHVVQEPILIKCCKRYICKKCLNKIETCIFCKKDLKNSNDNIQNVSEDFIKEVFNQHLFDLFDYVYDMIANSVQKFEGI